MTIYQEEMQRKAQCYGCITDYDEADQLLLISHKGVHLTAVNPEGFMFYNSKELTDPESREVFSHLVDDAETVREYVGLYESSPQMKPKDVQNYRKLSEYGDVVFAGMYSQKHGLPNTVFSSWMRISRSWPRENTDTASASWKVWRWNDALATSIIPERIGYEG